MTQRSLLAGLRSVVTIGYLYGIVRANVPQPASHFIFDFATGGLYAALWFKGFNPVQKYRTFTLRKWTTVLFAWPIVLFFVPIQNIFVQLVGLRGAIWFLPFLVIGGCLSSTEIYGLAVWLAGLNLVALGFGSAEYFWGVGKFFPHSNVTEIIELSHDVAGKAFRIPSSFVNPASYSATMNYTLPLLVSAWIRTAQSRTLKGFLLAGVMAASIGVFLSASRTQAMILLLFAAFVALTGQIRFRSLVALTIIGIGIGYLVIKTPRLQRFATLQDTDYVQRRFEVSANSTFLEAATHYPMGNGLGGGGTSLPYFLRSEVDAPLIIENEYGRILLELGLPGLSLWLAFLTWALAYGERGPRDEWESGRRLAWFTCLLSACVAISGIGMFTSIPGSSILFLLMGWISARNAPSRFETLHSIASGLSGPANRNAVGLSALSGLITR